MAGRAREIPSQRGHNYQDVNVYGKAQLGDTYYFGVLVPDRQTSREDMVLTVNRTGQSSQSFTVR